MDWLRHFYTSCFTGGAHYSDVWPPAGLTAAPPGHWWVLPFVILLMATLCATAAFLMWRRRKSLGFLCIHLAAVVLLLVILMGHQIYTFETVEIGVDKTIFSGTYFYLVGKLMVYAVITVALAGVSIAVLIFIPEREVQGAALVVTMLATLGLTLGWAALSYALQNCPV